MFGKIGTNELLFITPEPEEAPEGYHRVYEERPTPEHVLNADLEWELPDGV